MEGLLLLNDERTGQNTLNPAIEEVFNQYLEPSRHKLQIYVVPKDERKARRDLMQIKRLNVVKQMKVCMVTIPEPIIRNSFGKMMDVVISNICREPIQDRWHLKKRRSLDSTLKITPILLITGIRAWEIMLNKEHCNHQRGTRTHYTYVEEPKMPVTDRTTNEEPASKKHCGVCDGVVDLTSRVEKT